MGVNNLVDVHFLLKNAEPTIRNDSAILRTNKCNLHQASASVHLSPPSVLKLEN